VKGWLVALAVASVIGAAALVVIPIRHCPTCDGLTKAVDKATFRLDCPDCKDRGKVSIPRYLRGPSIDRDLYDLIQARRGTTELQQNHLERLESRSGREPGEALGLKQFGVQHYQGDFRFVRAEEKEYVLVLLFQEGFAIPGTAVAGIVLISTDGKVLDFIQATSSTRSGVVYPIFVEKAADGALACVKGRSIYQKAGSSEVPVLREVYRADVPGSAACPLAALTPPERARTDGIFRVGIKGDRFTFIEWRK
jgi:hypothetical protein